MDDSETNRLLEEIRDLQKSQLDLLQTWQTSIAAQHREFVNEKTTWLADREKLRQDHLAVQSRQIRARQWVRLYMLGLFLVVAIIWGYRFVSR